MIDEVIVLAAGFGNRIGGEVPKVFRKICGAYMLDLVLNIVPRSTHKTLVMSDVVKELYLSKNPNINNTTICVQGHRRGTGAAVSDGIKFLNKKSGIVAVLCGDTPFIKFSKLEEAANIVESGVANIVVMGFECFKPNSYGKIKTSDTINGGLMVASEIIEDSSDDNSLCNSGILVASVASLVDLLPRIIPNVQTGEYYLTSIVRLFADSGGTSICIKCDPDDAVGVNSLVDLVSAENKMRMMICEKMLNSSVHIVDPRTTYPSFDTVIGSGSVVEPNVIFDTGVDIGSNCVIGSCSRISQSKIGDRSSIGHGVVLSNSEIGKSVFIKPFSLIDGLVAMNNSSIGPFSRIRKDTTLGSGSVVGNFVEIKNSSIGSAVKTSHMSYIGDSDIGDDTNIGAGTVTCNYDGFNKYKTKIGKNVFVGSNSAFIAPVTVEDNCIIGAGCVVTKDVSSNDIVAPLVQNRTISGGVDRYNAIKGKKSS